MYNNVTSKKNHSKAPATQHKHTSSAAETNPTTGPPVIPVVSGILTLENYQVSPSLLVDLLEDLDRVLSEAAAREIEALQSGDKLGVGLLAEGGQEYPDGLICNLTEAQVQPQQSREHLRKLFANLVKCENPDSIDS